MAGGRTAPCMTYRTTTARFRSTGSPATPCSSGTSGSTWHRPYVTAIIGADIVAALLAGLTTITSVPQLMTQFRNETGFIYFLACVALPVGWLVALWAHGAYDRRYLGIGTDEFKRVLRASVTMIATVSFLAFTFKTGPSRVSVAVALVGGLVYIV